MCTLNGITSSRGRIFMALLLVAACTNAADVTEPGGSDTVPGVGGIASTGGKGGEITGVGGTWLQDGSVESNGSVTTIGGKDSSIVIANGTGGDVEATVGGDANANSGGTGGDVEPSGGGKDASNNGGGTSGFDGNGGYDDAGATVDATADAAVIDVEGGGCENQPCYDFMECMMIGVLGCGFTECVYLHPDTPFPFLGICK